MSERITPPGHDRVVHDEWERHQARRIITDIVGADAYHWDRTEGVTVSMTQDGRAKVSWTNAVILDDDQRAQLAALVRERP